MLSSELVLEIGVEEIPAGFIKPALNNMKKMMTARLDDLGLSYRTVHTAATPRRLAICVKDLEKRQPDSKEEFLGPPYKAAFDANKNPTKAAKGFAASKGADVNDLEIVDTAKGKYVRLIRELKGRSTDKLLRVLLPELILGLPFPKSMRWGDEKIVFVRPIQWIMAIFNGEVVPFEVGRIVSSSITKGHRFMAPSVFPVKNYDDYLEALRRNHVTADCDERREAVLAEINRSVSSSASGAGTKKVLPDEELVEIVTNLVESPHGVCGEFDERFLALPDSVLITAMREHQKYFSVTDEGGSLLANFVAINNTRVKDEKLAVAGHQRVLRARLEDALFFFKEDQSRSLADRVTDLSDLIFQAGLGTMKEKTYRVIRLAKLLAQELAPDSILITERAALLAKADLLTAMVNEFPTLQGVIGREYALLDGEKPEVATAIFEHYLPVRPGEDLPHEVPGALVGLADRLDTIAGCFGIGQAPTGTTDPFGLRRLALGFLHIIENRAFHFSLSAFIMEALSQYEGRLPVELGVAKANILDFIRGRFINDLISRGEPREAIEAVASVSFDDVEDCRARINALKAIRNQPTFTLLAAAFKRVMNIIKDNKEATVDIDLLTEIAERNLYSLFHEVRKEVNPLLSCREYDKALDIILRMKGSIDTFFDDVMVMVDDPRLRRNRLNLLTAVAELFLRVGDFSKMHTTHS